MNGCLPSSVFDGCDVDVSRSYSMDLIPGLWDILGGEEYLRKKIGSPSTGAFSVMRVFASAQFSGLKGNSGNYINRSMVMWSMKRRPCVLLFRIPSPMEVRWGRFLPVRL
jgi:hypothetical protein